VLRKAFDLTAPGADSGKKDIGGCADGTPGELGLNGCRNRKRSAQCTASGDRGVAKMFWRSLHDEIGR
jgi:hypothetical protein